MNRFISTFILISLLFAQPVLAQTETEKLVSAKTASPAQAQQTTSDQEPGWTVFRGDAHSTGVAKTELPDDVEVLWKFKVPKGAFSGTPVIVRSSAPESEDGTVYIADLDGTLFAFDLETGKKKWGTKLSISIDASPAYQNGKIYVGDIDGVFYCLDTEGKIKWKVEMDGEINSGASFHNGNVVIGCQDSNLYVLDPETGKEIIKHQTADQIRCSATIVGDRAFVAGCDGFFHVVNLVDGTEVGNVDINSPTQSTPAVLGDKVYFGTEQSAFYSVNWKTIKADWSFLDQMGQSSVRGSAAVTKDHVVFGARNRQVYSLDPVTGKKQWAVTLKSKVDGSPIIVGDRVYVGSTDGRFYALSLENGETVWEKEFNGGFLSSPAAAFGRLVVATDRGVVYCLGKKKTTK